MAKLMSHYYRDGGFPEWFRVENYGGTESYKGSDWLDALRIRKNILDVFKGLEKAGLDLSYVYKIMPETKSELEALRRAPLDGSVCRSWAEIAGDFFCKSDGVLPVREMTFSDLADCRKEDLLSAENGESSFNPWEVFEKSLNIPGELIGVPIGAGNRSHESLFVDMRATNAVLIKAFEGWLKRARVQRAERSKQKKPNYARWTSYGLLPYLDLLIWRKEEGVRRSSQEMAEAVGYCRSNENFQTTVVDLARRLMRDLGELEALASYEVFKL